MPASTLTATARPGSFTFESTLPPKLDINVGAKSHFFQPPKTPSASGSLQLSRVAQSGQDERPSTASKRKRSSRGSIAATPEASMPVKSKSWPNVRYESPAPLANSQYQLAGGSDTPTTEIAAAIEQDLLPLPDMPSQCGRWLRPLDAPEIHDYFGQGQDCTATALGRERNGHPRIPASIQRRYGLGKAVYNVAGKVWEFCRSTAFNGFFAGGGRGYELKTVSCYGHEGEEKMWQDTGEEDGLSDLNKPIPGRFPEEDFIPDYMSFDHSESSPSSQYPAKRIHRDKSEDEESMSTSWMVVTHTPTSIHERSPSSRRAIRDNALYTSASHASSSPTRKIASRSHHQRTRPMIPAPSSSFARCSPSPTRSRQHHHRTNNSTANIASSTVASFASPRSSTSSPCKSNSRHLPSPRRSHESTTSIMNVPSPLSPEVQRHAARLRRREFEEDANLKRFNAQLKAMIREGKEALGTRVEVEILDDG